jgi:hypothetical protein
VSQALVVFIVFAACAECERSAPTPVSDAPAAADPLDLPGVVDPWGWPRAAGASAHERAIEDIGPYEAARPK